MKYKTARRARSSSASCSVSTDPLQQRTSQDGWALGGVATLFTTAMSETGGTYQTGGMNNNFFESPGSDHPGGAHFGMADSSVHFLNDSIDHQVFSYLGAMADKQARRVALVRSVAKPGRAYAAVDRDPKRLKITPANCNSKNLKPRRKLLP